MKVCLLNIRVLTNNTYNSLEDSLLHNTNEGVFVKHTSTNK